MDESILLELTKCFARVSSKQDGTFLKMWCEGGAFRFHMSNNNNSRQSTFRHPSFNQHTMSTPSTTSTPDPRPSTQDPGPSTLDPGPSTLSTPDPEPICELNLREGVGEKVQRDEEQPSDEDEEPKDQPMIGEQPDGKQTEGESDESITNVNQYGYPDKGRFERAIYSYCEDVEIISPYSSHPLIDQVPCCCSLCKIHVNNNLKYVCYEHRGSAWHERTIHCVKINPTYDIRT